MKIKTGYLYHIKDEYFDVVNDDSLMQNHERGKKRPTYFTIKDKNILWFIPMSSKVDKYEKIIEKKIERYGFCNTIIIRKMADMDVAILLQNAFPTLEKYIDHIHTVDGVPLNVPTDLQNEIKGLFKNKLVIIPGFITKVGYFLTKITPLKLLLKIDYNMQRKKDK